MLSGPHEAQIYHVWILFLRAYFKNRVYKIASQNIPDLKAQTEEEIKKVSERTLKNVFSNNLLKHARACIAKESNHSQQPV